MPLVKVEMIKGKSREYKSSFDILCIGTSRISGTTHKRTKSTVSFNKYFSASGTFAGIL